MLFYEKLRQCREKEGLSQADVATRLNVTRQAVSKWENGINEPDINTILKLSDIYSVTLDDLLREDMTIVYKLAHKERSFKWLFWSVLVLGIIVLIGLSFFSVKFLSTN